MVSWFITGWREGAGVTRPEVLAGVEDVDLSGRTILVTGATRGVGRHAAVALARLGARVFVHGRDQDAGEAVLVELGGEGGFFRADFLSLTAVRDLATAVRDNVDELDVLVNNAGAYYHHAGLTEDGLERTMAVNHFAPFLLTNLLLPIMPDSGRIITTSSESHRRGSLEFDRFTSREEYDGFGAYAGSKLANVLFTRELSRRLEDRVANVLHPGFVPGSGLWRESWVPVRVLFRLLGRLPGPLVRLLADTPVSGARSIVYLAAAPGAGAVSGEYFVGCEPAVPAASARDDELAARLWEESVGLTGLGDDAVAGEDA